MSRIRANKITDKLGTGAIEIEKGAWFPVGYGLTGAGSVNITGVVTANSFSGDGSGLIGVASTDNIITGTAATFNTYPVDINAGMTVAGVSSLSALTATTGGFTGGVSGTTGTFSGAVSGTTGTFSGSVSVGGTLTYEDVINVDSVGVVTARAGLKVTGGTSYFAGAIAAAGAITGTASTATNVTVADESSDTTCFPTFVTAATGNLPPKTGSNLSFNSSTGQLNATKFVGDGSALTGIVVGLTTEALTTAGATVTLDLTKDDHKITKSGTYTVTCTGGSEGSSHSLRIENSGTSSVSFSSYFKFPSGGTPSLPTTNGAISLISFTVHKAGSVGVNTVLLSGASVNFS